MSRERPFYSLPPSLTCSLTFEPRESVAIESIAMVSIAIVSIAILSTAVVGVPSSTESTLPRQAGTSIARDDNLALSSPKSEVVSAPPCDAVSIAKQVGRT